MTRDEARAVAQEYATLGGNRQTRTLAKALRILLESEVDKEKAERERDEALRALEGQPVIESEWQQLVRERDEAHKQLRAKSRRLTEVQEKLVHRVEVLERERDEALSRAAKYAARADKAIDLARRLEKVNEAALALVEKRLERTRSWSDVRTHDERNALRAVVQALTRREC